MRRCGYSQSGVRIVIFHVSMVVVSANMVIYGVRMVLHSVRMVPHSVRMVLWCEPSFKQIFVFLSLQAGSPIPPESQQRRLKSCMKVWDVRSLK